MLSASGLYVHHAVMRCLAIGVVVGAITPLFACGDDGDGRETATTVTTQTSLTSATMPMSTSPTTGPDGTTGPGDTTGGVDDTRGEVTSPDLTTGPPVGCVEADCPAPGEYCSPDSGQCEPGCNDASDCDDGIPCSVEDHTCKCNVDSDCGVGTVCDAGACVAGCSAEQPCDGGLTCCDGTCFDVLNDAEHCGGCDACPPLMNAESDCSLGACGFAGCQAGFFDCDGQAATGCESSAACDCTPGSMIPCYSGPNGTADVGICKSGTQTCNAQGNGYGACVGEVTPDSVDTCSNGLDDDCNNAVDDDADADGDGYTRCGGDCCDVPGPACANPGLVNPGAFEVGNNMVDDDCDQTVDNALASCDGGLGSNSSDPTDYARAIDLCKFTTDGAQGPQKTWGVISGTLTRADGVGGIAGNARSIRTDFGTGGVVPQQNASLAILSTGSAADQNDANPGFTTYVSTVNGTSSGAPGDWLGANGGNFPNAPGCPGPPNTSANDSAMLKLRVRVPTNAQSFSVQMHFFSAEWAEWVCTAYNDLFVALIDSSNGTNPPDKNIAIYTTAQQQKYPVGVNIACAAPGLFTECTNGVITKCNNQQYNGCSLGTGPLAGTGMQSEGGTGWLKMSGNVTPGETMEIRFAIWDTGDAAYDSVVLLDDWVWSVQASQPGVMPN